MVKGKGRGKGGGKRLLLGSRIKHLSTKPSAVTAYERVIKVCDKQIREINGKLRFEKNPFKKIDLSIELCGRKINRANGQRELLEWFLKNPDALVVSGLKTTKTKIKQKIREAKKTAIAEERTAKHWRERRKIALKNL